ncbi:hypothetical protein CD790_23525 [Streptomyces sp. SAJ15]|nr:hypothetical protein CD790_23525 [Streptomyces sp. SAJ15]
MALWPVVWCGADVSPLAAAVTVSVFRSGRWGEPSVGASVGASVAQRGVGRRRRPVPACASHCVPVASAAGWGFAGALVAARGAVRVPVDALAPRPMPSSAPELAVELAPEFAFESDSWFPLGLRVAVAVDRPVPVSADMPAWARRRRLVRFLLMPMHHRRSSPKRA